MPTDLVKFNFSFNKSQVRVVVGEDGEPWFVARDVATVLGYSNTNDAILRHCRGVVKHDAIVDSLGRPQEARIIAESDVMRLVVHSKLPGAEAFEKWIFEEALPSIRRTGSYSVAPKFEIPKTYAEALQLAADLAKKTEALEAENTKMLPKAELFDMAMDSSDTIDIGECAKALNIPGIGRNKLFRKLRDAGVAMDNNVPYQKFVDAGYFKVIEKIWTKSDGTKHVALKTVVFQKGLDFIKRLLLGKNTPAVAV